MNKEMIQAPFETLSIERFGNVKIITPETGIDPEIQATWMIDLLQKIYTNHGISNSKDRLIQEIADRKTKCFFSLDENNQPIATTALIDLGNKVESGRSVSIIRNKGIGGNLIRTAIKHHLETDNRPLVAEVRLADEFDGVPGSRETQILSFKELGFKPHAVVPAFAHGNPERTEFFAFSAIQKRQRSNWLFLPKEMNFWRKEMLALTNQLFETNVHVLKKPKTETSVNLQLIQTNPFTLMVPTQTENHLSNDERKQLINSSRFTLVPVEGSSENLHILARLAKWGFKPCGIDSELGQNNHPILLMGKLKFGTLLAPALSTKVLPKEVQRSIKVIAHNFKSSVVPHEPPLPGLYGV